MKLQENYKTFKIFSRYIKPSKDQNQYYTNTRKRKDEEKLDLNEETKLKSEGNKIKIGIDGNYLYTVI